MTPVEIIWRPLKVWHGSDQVGTEKQRWRGHTVHPDYTSNAVAYELEHMDVLDAVIETDHDRDGFTRAGRPRASAEGRTPRVQLWFDLDGRDVCLPSAAFSCWRQNLKALELTLARQRQIREYGVATVQRQYAGFEALPPGGDESAGFASPSEAARFLLKVAGSEADAVTVLHTTTSSGGLRDAYRRAAEAAHPDKPSGSDALMAQVNAARDLIKEAMS